MALNQSARKDSFHLAIHASVDDVVFITQHFITISTLHGPLAVYVIFSNKIVKQALP